MAEARIFEGKTTNEAIEKGLKELKVSKNDVEIKVLEKDEKRSFFDILAPRGVKIEMKLKDKKEEKKAEVTKKTEYIKIDTKVVEKAKDRVETFLNKFLKMTTGEDIKYDSEIKDNTIRIIINDKKADFLIGYRGETLNAMQTILNAVAVKETNERIRVELDILDYREKRKIALEELAEKIAKSVIRTRKSIALEPMTPYERKIIHTKLQENNKVKTVSVGEGIHRKIIVSLK